MKKILVLLALCLNLAFGAVWSSSSQDGIVSAFEEYNNVVRRENNIIVKRYNILSNTTIDKILENDTLKRDILIYHRELLKEETLDKNSLAIEVERLKHLLDNEAMSVGQLKTK